MKSLGQRGTRRRDERGQTFLLFVFFAIVIILFAGLGLDIGFAYITKASLSKGVDAACLAGIRNLAQGDAQASAVASSAFAANYGRPGRDVGVVTPVINFGFDANNNKIINVSAGTTINTFFIRVLPRWKTLHVNATAQATRAKLIMTLVLDRSGSMAGNGGAGALPPDVGTFTSCFDDANDQVAMASFASAASLDVAMCKPFKAKIIAAANALSFMGGTFSQGGLTNALVQNLSVPVQPNENAVRVVVFFTDGLANEVQATFTNCPSSKTMNFGGYDTPGTVGFFDPATVGNAAIETISDGATPTSCPAATGFTSAMTGTLKSFTQAHVKDEAKFRALATANDIRNAGMVIYSIGLGNNLDPVFLMQVANANDPANPTFNPNQPVGEYVNAPDSAHLLQVFLEIASKILLRLTQ